MQGLSRKVRNIIVGICAPFILMGNESGDCGATVTVNDPVVNITVVGGGGPGLCAEVEELCEVDYGREDLCRMAVTICENQKPGFEPPYEPPFEPPHFEPPVCGVPLAANVHACAELDAVSRSDVAGAEDLAIAVDRHCFDARMPDYFVTRIETCECYIPEPHYFEPQPEPCFLGGPEERRLAMDEPYQCATLGGASSQNPRAHAQGGVSGANSIGIDFDDDALYPPMEPICECSVVEICEPVEPPHPLPYPCNADGCVEPPPEVCPDPNYPGVHYAGYSMDECAVIDVACTGMQEFFYGECGCGCIDIDFGPDPCYDGNCGEGQDCVFEGDMVLVHGQSVRAADGCNTCTCNDGNMECTEMGCVDGFDPDICRIDPDAEGCGVDLPGTIDPDPMNCNG